MKVGTDAVLMGTWVRLPEQGFALDIGTGSGILALMLAQRSISLEIHAIDIDRGSAFQSAFNFGNSAWSNRLMVWNSDVANFIPFPPSLRYQLIISNPPFFINSFKASCKRRNLARHTDSLPHENLIEHAARLLAPEGHFSVVIPAESQENFIQNCLYHQLWPARICKIIPVEGRDANRVMIETTFLPIKEPECENLVLRDKNFAFTPAYQAMIKDFILA
ncbi:methyltransferase [Bacteroidales bacterium]